MLDLMAFLLALSIGIVINVHSLWLAAIDLRLPRLLGIVTYAATLLSFLLVGVANSANKKRDFLPILLFALAYIAVLILLVHLDRPQGGLFRVSQTVLWDLLRQMGAPAP